MATDDFANLNEQTLIKRINFYFKDLIYNKKNAEINFENEENHPMNNIINRNSLRRKIFLHLINDFLNKIIIENSIENRDSFNEFILKANRISIIIKNIFFSLTAAMTGSDYNKKLFYSNLVSKFGSLSSDVDLKFILSCEILKYFSFEVIQELLGKINTIDFNYDDNEIIEYKKALKNFYFDVNKYTYS